MKQEKTVNDSLIKNDSSFQETGFHSECEYDLQCSSSVPNSFCNLPSGHEEKSLNTTTESEAGICDCIEGHYYRKSMNYCFKKKCKDTKPYYFCSIE